MFCFSTLGVHSGSDPGPSAWGESSSANLASDEVQRFPTLSGKKARLRGLKLPCQDGPAGKE